MNCRLHLSFVLLALPLPAQQFDSRLSVHTLVREDIFAGFLANDMERFTQGEKNIERLLAERQSQKADLLAWQGGALLYRAARAHEAGRTAEFDEVYTRALARFDEAGKLSDTNLGVRAVTGGSFLVFADRLPEKHRAAAWERAYEGYQALWKMQGHTVEKMPLHIKGELLAGMTQSAQRTGRKAEAAEFLEKMTVLLAGTPYESRARRWKEHPEAAAKTSLGCQSCHESGRLAARTAALTAK